MMNPIDLENWIKEILIKYKNDSATCSSMPFRSEEWIRGFKAHAEFTKAYAEFKLRELEK